MRADARTLSFRAVLAFVDSVTTAPGSSDIRASATLMLTGSTRLIKSNERAPPLDFDARAAPAGRLRRRIPVSQPATCRCHSEIRTVVFASKVWEILRDPFVGSEGRGDI
jgi:hypothetical protein